MTSAEQDLERIRLRRRGSREYVDYVLATSVTSQCCMCGKKDLSTLEDFGPECQLSDGRWVCSRECWELAVVVTNRDRLVAAAEDEGQIEATFERLLKASLSLRDDMLVRSRAGVDVIHGEEYRIVNAGRTAWAEFVAALEACDKP